MKNSEAFFTFSSDSRSLPQHVVSVLDVIHSIDTSPCKIYEAEENGLNGLISKGTLKVACWNEIHENAVFLSGRYLSAIKDEATNKKKSRKRVLLIENTEKY